MANILDAQLIRDHPLLPELKQRVTWDAWVTYRPYPYADPNNCRVTVFRSGRRIFVVLSEAEGLYRNPLSNDFASVATALVRHPVLWDVMKPEEIVWVEHHPASSNADETWDLVVLKWEWQGESGWKATEPTWAPLSRNAILRLIRMV